MQEIKFRAFDLVHKKMHSVRQINFMGDRCYLLGKNYEYHFPNECVLMQFTGLKDRVERDIYESDILKDKDGELLLVMWGEGEWLAGKLALNSNLFLEGSCKYLEIIGNVYQDSHLIDNSNAMVRDR